VTKPVLFVLGTRPEAIKLWPVIERTREEGLPFQIISTGQQADLLPPILTELGIVPDVTLERSTGHNVGMCLAEWVHCLIPILSDRPGVVVVQGDTTSALAGALAAYYESIPVAHVEAGLRSYAKEPHPEEGNRRMISQIASLHFTPTRRATLALGQEYVPGTVIQTGNTIVDALRRIVPDGAPLGREGILVTIHRRENWGRIREIVAAVAKVPHAGMRVRWVLHSNRELVRTVSDAVAGTHIELVAPMGYKAFIRSLATSRVVITDSGGVVEESTTLGVPAVNLRESTERPEANAILCADLEGLENAVQRALSLGSSLGSTVFGDGNAAEGIARELKAFLGS
jgi:UDP-N-acetylglucosamine 2-epimerase (non-hydrolysing)